MKRRSVYKILGVAIVVFWLIVLGEQVRKSHFSPNKADLTHDPRERSQLRGSEQWMEIFLKGRKVGYSVTRATKIKEELEVTEEIFLALNLMGSVQRIASCTRAIVDEKFLLKRFNFSISSGVIGFKASGQIEGNNLSLKVGGPGGEEVGVIRLPEKPMMSAGLTQYLRTRSFRVGEEFSVPLFDPVSMTTTPATVRVVGTEKLRVQGESYEALRLEMKFLGRPLVLWLDEEGVALKEQGLMGFTLVRSNPIKAPAGLDESEKHDFYDLAAIRTKEKLKNPRKLSYLKVQFNNVPPSLPADGLRQSLTGTILSVERERPPFGASYTIPYRGDDGRLVHYLMPELLIQAADEEIVKLANEIVGGVTDPYLASKMILGWVFENIEKVPVVSVPDAKAILEHRKGDCNEHATLVAALLRAIGIPARIVVGLVFKDERFYYHAWNEVYLDRWVSLDAVLNQMPTDATHIKLINGGIENQIQLVGIMGTLTLKVLDYR